MALTVIYPTLHIGYSSFKRPKWSAGTQNAANGREVRVGLWANPLWEWDLTYEYLPDEQLNGITTNDLRTLMGFDLSTSGMFEPFLYLDPDDNQVTGQGIGNTNGVLSDYILFRTYGLNPYQGNEPVGQVNLAETFNLYIDNALVDPSTYDVNRDSPVHNYVHFHTLPDAGLSLSVDMSYYYLARISDDKIDFEKFMNLLWSLKKITLMSVREI